MICCVLVSIILILSRNTFNSFHLHIVQLYSQLLSNFCARFTYQCVHVLPFNGVHRSSDTCVSAFYSIYFYIYSVWLQMLFLPLVMIMVSGRKAMLASVWRFKKNTHSFTLTHEGIIVMLQTSYILALSHPQSSYDIIIAVVIITQSYC